MSGIFDTRASGKLLLTGEYFVLDGAVALALPVRFGQTLRAIPGPEQGILEWSSIDEHGQTWFQGSFLTSNFDIITDSDAETARTLQSILFACRSQNPAFLTGAGGIEVRTQNDFPRIWGLGTSSTLIAALSRWAEVDPYRLLFDTLGGSGYDIACAYAEGPVLYQLKKAQPTVQRVDFQPPFVKNIFFVYLGKKQNSREGILRYRQRAGALKPTVAEINRLTERFLGATTLSVFEQVIQEHEAIVSRALDLPTVKSQFFEDFPGAVKSLGAWGGDFVLATSHLPENETRAYFREKGFETVLGWEEMMGG
jgi:mevalonate kinase